ncbi:NACHT domain-containing protein [Tolypothrix sp. FACHB-123]|uniref:NACHT domain-containing protein n=1 Tax=Tolypothrix sp. FACHB-123 TaxID=2692868 RepID=UPI00168503AD|nr:NACHT domain-containing protein [Tolypothrix sp. FACHB-123]MBD2358564.1 NACHT domain-containing protein [Tolypothrix sp. FACHB-123]
MSEEPLNTPHQILNISDAASLENTQIGGIAGRDVNVSQIQGKVVNVTVYDHIHAPNGLSGQPVIEIRPLTQYEYRQRENLLNSVKNFWIEDFLKKSLHTKVLINLGLEERPNAIQNRFPGVQEFSEPTAKVLLEDIEATEYFQKMGTGRNLLILGEPGSGKTITLLKIAQSLITRTESNLSLPIPVVFNLSSWANNQETISKWLVQELALRYDVPKSLGKKLIREQQLILLLDGLDEVKAEYRSNCLKNLNQFIQSHGVTEIVVCCRIRDYEALAERLKLQSAICIQPLNNGQIDKYLEMAGEQLVALKNLLQQNNELREFAKSPLILSVMSLTYKDCSVEELSSIDSAQEWLKRLFDKYIKRMFERRGSTQLYPQEKTKHWLIWLAQMMLANGETVFLIEQLQPQCLVSRKKIILYKITTIILGILFIIQLDMAISNMLAFFQPNGYQAFNSNVSSIFNNSQLILVYIFQILIYGLLFGYGKDEIKTVYTIKFSIRKTFTNIYKLLEISIFSGLFFGLSLDLIIDLFTDKNILNISLWVKYNDYKQYTHCNDELCTILNGLSAAFSLMEKIKISYLEIGNFFILPELLSFILLIIIIIWLCLGYYSGIRMFIKNHDFRVFEKRNSWLIQIIHLIIIFIIISFIIFPAVNSLLYTYYEHYRPTFYGVELYNFYDGGLLSLGGIVLSLIISLIYLLNKSITNYEIKDTKLPNEGIWRTVKNTIFLGFSGALIGALISVIFIQLLKEPWHRFTIFAGCIFISMLFGLFKGGIRTCIRHFALRLILTLKGKTPWDYSKFLEYATERLFIQKVGGGYIFIHRILLEHFAKMELEQERR